VSLLSASRIEPILRLAVVKLPEGPEWTCEHKFDGRNEPRSECDVMVSRHAF
jgi:hypothetical protein